MIRRVSTLTDADNNAQKHYRPKSSGRIAARSCFIVISDCRCRRHVFTIITVLFMFTYSDVIFYFHVILRLQITQWSSSSDIFRQQFVSHQWSIGVDLAGLLGGRMASAEGGSVSSGMAYGEGCPLSSRLSGLGERRELPQRGPGRRKRILAYFEGHGQSSRYTATT